MNNSPQPAAGLVPAAHPEPFSTWAGHMADDVAATYGPEPLATLTASPEELTLHGTRGHFRIPRAAITKVGRGGFYPWFFAAVRLHHMLPEVPRSLQFKPLGASPAEVRAQLRGLGYPVPGA